MLTFFFWQRIRVWVKGELDLVFWTQKIPDRGEELVLVAGILYVL